MHSRFTLVELMIVVAIVMILAAIAIPNFNEMQLRAKRAELPSNVDGIATAFVAYITANDVTPPSGGWNPDGSPGKAQRAWTTGDYFEDAGYAPDGMVRGSYQHNATGCPPNSVQGVGLDCTSGSDSCISGMIDVDDDGDEPCLFIRIHDGGNNPVTAPDYDYWAPNIY